MLQASSNSEAGPPSTLVNIALDLQIIICTLLHPSDILALRETCKALQLPTRQRVVWVAVLHRVCLENSLFLPSFPILDMSDVELEHAALRPRRWVDLCAAFKKQHPNDPGAKLRPRKTRFIEHSFLNFLGPPPELFIVPGGRYMVSSALNRLSVWDMGFTSSADCKLISSVGLEAYSCMVQATPDGMGLIILTSHPDKQCSVYEIYPQSETPQLTCIAHLHFDHLPLKPCACLLPDRAIWFRFHGNSIIFSVWDFRMNYSKSFSAHFDFDDLEYHFKIIATKTAIFLLCVKEILVWAVPTLSSQPPDSFDHHPTHIPPLFGIAFPDGILCDGDHEFLESQTMSHWYFGSSQPLYFSILCRDSTLRIFEIVVKPNLFDTSLHMINTELVSHDFDEITFQRYAICEDTFVTCWESGDTGQFGALTSRLITSIPHGNSVAKVLLSSTTSGYYPALCPASGRYIHLDKDVTRVVVVDLF